MEDSKRIEKFEAENDKEIIFSKSVKAGKRIYYLDVKKNRKEELFLAITESKKVIYGEGEAARVSFEKHKIFLYQEDFDKFLSGLQEAISYINASKEGINLDKIADNSASSDDGFDDKIKIDIDFE